MKKIASVLFGLAALALSALPASAQSCPPFTFGEVLTAGQWQSCFDSKQNALGYVPVNKAGDVMTGGPLVMSASSTAKAGIRLTPGVAPTSPVNGDFWITSAGVFAQVNGATQGPFAVAGSSAFAATAPLAVTFPSSVVTYAINFNSSLVNTAGNLGINLTHSNVFSAAQTISLNAATLPSALTGTVLRVGQADATIARFEVDSFGTASPGVLSVVYGRGTGASPTAVQSGDEIGSFNTWGYTGAATLSGTAVAAFRTYASENFSSGHQGSRACVATTTISATTLTDRLCVLDTGFATLTGSLTAQSGTAIPAGGTQDVGLMLSSVAHFGAFFGSGVPTLSAAQGSLYLRSDGAASTRMYVNTNGTTGWSAFGDAGITSLTGDVTATGPGAAAATVVNLPTGVTMAGNLLATKIAAPSTPSAGTSRLWVDSTDLRFHDKDAGGTVGTTVIADTGASNNYISAISAAGVITKSRPACATLSDSSGGCSMSTTAGGDLSGTLPSPTVAKINGVALGTTTATSGNLLIGSGTTWATQAMSGDATLAASGAVTIAANAVSNAKLATAADSTIKSNISGGTASPSDNTITAVLDKQFGTTQGSVIYRNATVWTVLTPGTSGQFFTTQGAAANPIWSSGGAGTGTVTQVVCGGVTITASGICPPLFDFKNCSLAASVATNILTVALKDNAGSDPSASSPCQIAFRSATATTGSWVIDNVTGALSITTNATGATLGSVNNKAFRFWVVAFDNGGTVVLSLFNASNVTTAQCSAINETLVQSSTAISGSATGVGVYYTPNGTTLSSKAIKILGYVEYNSSGLATAGTYASAPNFIQTFGPGVARPCTPTGNTVPATTTTRGTASTSTTYTTTGVTLSGSITPASAANGIRVSATGGISIGNGGANGGNGVALRIIRGTSGNVQVGANFQMFGPGNGVNAAYAFSGSVSPGLDYPNTASSQTYSPQVKTNNVATDITFPYGDTADSNPVGYMLMEEIQG